MDVLVLGLGVSGSYAVWRIAEQGFRVTGYDPQRIYAKACGDATPSSALSGRLAEGLDAVVDTVSSFRIAVNGFVVAEVNFTGAAWYIIDKTRFVQTMRENASSAGAVIVYSRPPERASLVVDARGPYSGRDYMILYRIIARARWDPGLALIDFRPSYGGLYWVFPRGDGIVNVGGGFLSITGGYKALIKAVQEYAKLLIGEYEVLKAGGAPLSVLRTPKLIDWNGRIRLGEAAGLVNATSGEGIRQSILSAYALADSLERCGLNLQCIRSTYPAAAAPVVFEATLSRLLLRIAGRPGGEKILEALPESFWRSYLKGEVGASTLFKAIRDKPGILRVILEALTGVS